MTLDLDELEITAKEYVRRQRLTEPKWEGSESIILALIEVVRKKDKALKYYSIHAYKMRRDGVGGIGQMASEALALTEQLK